MKAAYARVPKTVTDVSLADSLLTDAKELAINISQAAEVGLAKAVADKRAEIWQKSNAEAIGRSPASTTT